MLTQIYKPGQGKNTRLVTGLSAGAIVLLGCYRLWQMLKVTDANVWLVYTPPFIVFCGLGLLIYWLMNKPSVADFMILAEGELKKVNWSTKHEIFVSTVVVIVVVVILAFILGVADLGYQLFFRWVFAS